VGADWVRRIQRAGQWRHFANTLTTLQILRVGKIFWPTQYQLTIQTPWTYVVPGSPAISSFLDPGYLVGTVIPILCRHACLLLWRIKSMRICKTASLPPPDAYINSEHTVVACFLGKYHLRYTNGASHITQNFVCMPCEAPKELLLAATHINATCTLISRRRALLIWPPSRLE